MTLSYIRLLFVALAMVVGYQLGLLFGEHWGWLGALIGCGGAGLIILFERSMAHVSVRGLSAAVFGLMLALIVSKLLTRAIDHIEMDTVVSSSIKIVMVLILSYLGMVFALRGRDEFNLVIPYVKLQREEQYAAPVLLDTSVIIDGRIVDILTTNFLEGRFILPSFVLKELQTIADSSDALKRNRGRRGLDTLNTLRKNKKIGFKIQEDDAIERGDVDEKLVRLAKVLSAKVLTNDYNLNKIAQLQEVTVLNINDLANALKPVLIPGQTLDLHLMKEGKEPQQAVAYLNDGTMVVVENAKKDIGKTVKATVTSALQTSAGRMIFAKLAREGSS